LASFVALGLFGTLSWSRLLSGSGDERRLFGMLALATVLAVGGLLLTGRRRLLLIPAGGVGLLATLALAGVPLQWITHVRIAVTLRSLDDGLTALPGLLVPYLGINPWVRMVIVLGAGVLLLDAAILFGLAPRSAGLARRGVAALPLIALATVPTTVVHPRFAYVDGVVLFVLLAAYVWGDRVDRYESLAAIGLCGVAAAGAMVIAPGLDRHRAWLDYQTLATKIAAAGPVETFDWAQTYGPIVWPRHGHPVLEIKAARPDYWKAESLDSFDGHSWVSGSVTAPTDALLGISASTVRRWTQSLRVTFAGMESADVIAAGVAQPPVGLQSAVLDGASPGTWVAQTGLSRGDSYHIKVYDPQPSAAQLTAAGTEYPRGLLPGYLTLSVPEPALTSPVAGSVAVEDAIIPPFGSPSGIGYGGTAASPASVLGPSPYARTYLLARSLVRGSRTPYAYVLAVQHYLAAGYSYRENTRRSGYPLETFLFGTKAGYCQQFAGAMALLLRLGGVPARVAVGFSSGTYDNATGQYLVSDSDAHAWVEAFFPRYGWVRFDPTPPADPALRGLPPNLPISTGLPVNKSAIGTAHHPLGGVNTGSAASSPTRGSGGWSLALLIVLALGGGGLLAVAAALSRPLRTVEARVAELERAFVRTGRQLAPSTTLATIERRLADAPLAGAYVRALARQRFAGARAAHTATQRRALRAALRRGLGLSGTARSWWALPPRRAS
jgi:hypothetical protein